MKKKIIKTVLFILSFIVFLLYVGPVITTGEINIGVVTGIAIAVVILLYGLLFDKINSFIKKLFYKKATRILSSIISVILVICVLIATVTFALVKNSSKADVHKTDVVIVLGCKVNGDQAGVFLRGRINTAYKYLSSNPNAVAVLSGGQGENEKISEARCMYNYLVSMGIDSKRLMLEETSTSTYENFKKSVSVLRGNNIDIGEITVVTNDFHEYRACAFAKECGFTPYKYPSKTPWNGYMPFATREIFAIVYYVFLHQI